MTTDAADTAAKIRSFGRLSLGWHFGEGKPASVQAIAIALSYEWLFQCSTIEQTDAFPGAGGEIMITGYSGKHYIEITVESDLKVRFVYEVDRVEKTYGEDLAPYQAYVLLTKAFQSVEVDRWNLLGSLALDIIGTRSGKSLRTLDSSTWSTMPETRAFPALNGLAPRRVAAAFAGTLNVSTESYQATRLSTGSLLNPTLREVA